MNKVKNLIIIVLIIIFTASIVPKTFQNDTFFTIAIGEKVLNNEDVNSLLWHEDINFVHSGVFDIIITSIYNLFNFNGIYAFVMLVAVAQMVLYYYVLNSIIKKREISFVLTIITAFFLSEEFAARAQILSFTIFLIEFYCIENLANEFKKRYVVVLCILPVLLGNLHSSVFPVYFAIYLPYIAQIVLSKFNLKNKEDSKIIIENKNSKVLLILFFLSFLLGLCSSTTFSVYTDMYKVMKGISTNFISELQPLNIFSSVYFSILFIITIALIGFTKIKVKLTDSLYILGFGLMALSTFRCIFFFYLISSICIFRIVNTFIDFYGIKIDFHKRYINVISAVLICSVILITSIKNFSARIANEYVDITEYPVDVSNYILENLNIEEIKIYNHFNFGSYLEFNGIKAFIDSRSGLFTDEFNPGCTILQDWENVEYGSVKYKEIFEKYNITHAVLYKKSILDNYMAYDSEWNLLYDNGNFSLYEKVK